MKKEKKKQLVLHLATGMLDFIFYLPVVGDGSRGTNLG